MNSDSDTFRWSWKKIRVMSLSMGAAVLGIITLFVLWDVVFGSQPSVNGPLNDLAMGVGLAVAGGGISALLIAAVLTIGRASSKTVITAEGLLVQRALWHRNLVKWSEIDSVARRDINGWAYLYMKTSSTFVDVGMSIEVDNLRQLEAAIARRTPPQHPLRVELAKYVI